MKKRFILASRSPRREQLLTSIGLDFTIDPPLNYEEVHPEGRHASELVKINAIGKAESVAPNHPKAIVMGVDTVGAFQDEVLEKPKNHADAVRMLRLLQGTTHEVMSAICLIDTERDLKLTAVETTHIEFLPLTDHQIELYLKKGESMDKAAAYAAQGLGSIFIKRFDGDFFNVVGLPMARLNLMLKELGLDLFELI